MIRFTLSASSAVLLVAAVMCFGAAWACEKFAEDST